MKLLNKKAPDFTLLNSEGKSITLSNFLGKKVLLVFYPKDETAVCTKQLCEYSNFLNEFNELGVEVLAISSDPVESHQKFKRNRNLTIELLSDINHEIAKKYNAISFLGTTQRAIFIIGEEGIVRYENKVLPLLYQKKNNLIKIIKEIFENKKIKTQ